MPFYIADQGFQKIFLLVDAIYPKYSRFICTSKEPVTNVEKSFTRWQEFCRKDAERAFGGLQGNFQCMARHIHIMDLNEKGNMVTCCLIMHNMCVSDRVMSVDANALYNPEVSLVEDVTDTASIQIPYDMEDVLKRVRGDDGAGRIAVVDIKSRVNAARRQVQNDLIDVEEWTRLQLNIVKLEPTKK